MPRCKVASSSTTKRGGNALLSLITWEAAQLRKEAESAPAPPACHSLLSTQRCAGPFLPDKDLG